MSQNSQIDVSSFVQVDVVVAPLAIPYQNFGILMVIGDSGVIDTLQRYRIYTSLDGVGADFGINAPEYAAAQIYFSQQPPPAQIYIGSWARTAQAGILHADILTPTEQLISNFTGITSGAFSMFIDGAFATVSGLNFSAALNLPAVAALIQTAMQSAFGGTPTCVWNSNTQRFDFISGTTGVASSVSYGQAPTAFGKATFSANPTANDTLTIGGTTVTFVASGATGNQVNIGLSQAATQTALTTFLNGSADVNLAKNNYYNVGSVIYMVCKTPGAGGNSTTLAKVSTAITVSGATFTGGSGTDISTNPLGLTAASGAGTPVPGIAAETALAALTAQSNASLQWYAASFAASVQPSDADNEACAAYILGTSSSRTRLFGITIQSTACLDPTQTQDLASVLQLSNNKRVFWQYSSSNPYAVCSMFGRAATVNFDESLSTITLAYKQEPGVTGEYLTQSQFATVVAKGGNVDVVVATGTSVSAIMLWPGQMSNGFWFDEVHGTDWFANRVQIDVFNLFYTSTTKIPQTDPGSNQIATAITGSCEAAVNNGFAAPGIWQASPFGMLETGDLLSTGYYIYYPPIATQSEADRVTRVSVPIQIALKLAGAVHIADITVNVNR